MNNDSTTSTCKSGRTSNRNTKEAQRECKKLNPGGSVFRRVSLKIAVQKEQLAGSELDGRFWEIM
jgi:hypothetical protein